jgi:hypothetical protein
MGEGATHVTQEDYLAQKNILLERCLRLTEDIYSNAGKWESLEGLLDKRMAAIADFQSLEESVDDGFRQSCPKADMARLDSKLALVLEMNAKAEKALRDARDSLLDSMRSNTKEQQFTRFDDSAPLEKGRFLDIKE